MKSVTFALMLIATLAINFMIISHVGADRIFSSSRKNNARSPIKQLGMNLALPNSESEGSNPLMMLARPCPITKVLSNPLRESTSQKNLNHANSKNKIQIQAKLSQKYGSEICSSVKKYCESKGDKKTKTKWIWGCKTIRKKCWKRNKCYRYRKCQGPWWRRRCYWRRKCKSRRICRKSHKRCKFHKRIVGWNSQEKNIWQMTLCIPKYMALCGPYFISQEVTKITTEIENKMKDVVRKTTSDINEAFKKMTNAAKFLEIEAIKIKEKFRDNLQKSMNGLSQTFDKYFGGKTLFKRIKNNMNDLDDNKLQKFIEEKFLTNNFDLTSQSLTDFSEINAKKQWEQLEDKKKIIKSIVVEELDIISGNQNLNNDSPNRKKNIEESKDKIVLTVVNDTLPIISDKFSSDWYNKISGIDFTIDQIIQAAFNDEIKKLTVVNLVGFKKEINLSNLQFLILITVIYAVPALIFLDPQFKNMITYISRVFSQMSIQYQGAMSVMLDKIFEDSKIEQRNKIKLQLEELTKEM